MSALRGGGALARISLIASRPMDDLPFDFTEYVSNRLGLAEEETKRLLVAWLRTYQPAAARPHFALAGTRAPDLDDSSLDFRRAG
jgi:hypothetical protein